MENDISGRLSLIIKELGLNKNSFSKAIGITNNVTIGRIINENRQPSYEVLEKTIQTFGNINANWLLTGEGEIFLKEEKKENLTLASKEMSCPNCEMMRNYIKLLEEKIAGYEGKAKTA